MEKQERVRKKDRKEQDQRTVIDLKMKEKLSKKGEKNEK